MLKTKRKYVLMKHDPISLHQSQHLCKQILAKHDVFFLFAGSYVSLFAIDETNFRKVKIYSCKYRYRFIYISKYPTRI